MGTVTPLLPLDAARHVRRVVPASPAKNRQRVPSQPLGASGLLALGLLLAGIAFFALALIFLLYQMNGGRFWPLDGEMIPLLEWRTGDQDFFWRLLAISGILFGLLILTWTGMFLCFLGRSVRKRFARQKNRAERRERHFRKTIERLQRLG